MTTSLSSSILSTLLPLILLSLHERDNSEPLSSAENPELVDRILLEVRTAISSLPTTWTFEDQRHIGRHLSVLEQALAQGILSEVEARVDAIVDAAPADWRPVIDRIRAELRLLLDAHWAGNASPTRSPRAERFRASLSGYSLAAALSDFANTSPAVLTYDDHLALVELALDEGDFATIALLYRGRLRSEVPHEILVRCADVMWRRFRDLVPQGDSVHGAFANQALDLYLEAKAIERAIRLAHQLFDLLNHAQSYRLWDAYRGVLFRAFDKTMTSLPTTDCDRAWDWAVDRIAELQSVGDASNDEEISSLRTLIQDFAQRSTDAALGRIGLLIHGSEPLS